MHTAGPKSFARLREEMKNEDPNKKPPTLAQMFERTRKRKKENIYQDSFEDTSKKIEAMKSYNPPEDGIGSSDAFAAVMPKEYTGYRRLYGKGVTNKMLKNVSNDGSSYVVPREVMESFRADVEVEKISLLDMRKELEEEYKKKNAELEANHQRKLEEMKKDFDVQKESIVADVLNKLLSNVPIDVAKKYFT